MQRPAILFDIDGTLVDSNEAHVDAWCRAFSAEGVEIGRSEIREQIGKGGDNLLPSLLPDASEALRSRIDRAHGDIYKRDYLPHVQPFEGARAILAKAAALGQKVVLASSASRPELDHYVDLLGARDVLAGTTSKDDVGHSKPCPDIFSAAVETIGCSPTEALVVGDTPYDIIAAKRAGIAAVAVLSGGFPEATLWDAGALEVRADVAEILKSYETSALANLASASI
jgi:membrane protein